MRPPLQITSAANPRVKALVRLRGRRERREQGLILVEEPLVIRRALDAGVPAVEVWACPQQMATATAALYAEIAAAGVPTVAVPPQVMDKVAYRTGGEGLLLVARRHEAVLADVALPADRPALVVVLENVEKPGNLGAVLRIADGAGAQAVVCTGEGADPGNPNCLRASRGAAFAVPAIEAPLAETAAWLTDRGVTILAATPDGGRPWDEVDLTGPLALVLGAEHDGVSAAWLAATQGRVAIPMAGTGDSLNVAASAAVLLYEAVRQRRAAGRDAR
ncbi:MAG: RNA methyltransferase [Krumholzibacteria bacterium]|nr:RNA methyltransferase [Candidatus Krumholzibacteria bacterium]